MVLKLGFTDKNKFRLILDSRTPNEGNALSLTKITRYFKSVQQEVTYSGLIIEKQVEYYVKGYDNTNPFNYYPFYQTKILNKCRRYQFWGGGPGKLNGNHFPVIIEQLKRTQAHYRIWSVNM